MQVLLTCYLLALGFGLAILASVVLTASPIGDPFERSLQWASEQGRSWWIVGFALAGFAVAAIEWATGVEHSPIPPILAALVWSGMATIAFSSNALRQLRPRLRWMSKLVIALLVVSAFGNALFSEATEADEAMLGAVVALVLERILRKGEP
jgi:hypothetical protein